MAKRVAIIGGGIAGLSAGIYLQRSGYDCTIFEMNKAPGGLCTAWNRADYTIDNCVHWLVGSSPASPLYQLWNEVVDLSQIQFVDFSELFRVEDTEGNQLVLFTDVDALEDELLRKAPEDSRLVRAFTKGIRNLTRYEMPVGKAPELMTWRDGLTELLRMLPHAPTLLRWGRVSLGQLAEKARNPLLRRLWMHAFVPEMAAVFVALTVAWMHKKCAGYPLGGSRPLAEKVAASFLAAGGTLHYGARVCKILTRNGRATGVVLADGEEQQAEIVISAADAHMTIFELLGGDFFDSRITKLFQQFTPFPSYVLVALGVARSFADIPHSTLLPCQPPLQLDSGTVVHDLPVRISTFDPMLAPPGKTLISCWLTTRDFAYWLNLRKSDRAKYKEEKERLAMQVVEVLDARYGHVKDCLEMVDVAAPATVIRYTNNYQGSFEGWVLTPQVLTRRIAKTLPGLDGFYMAGHWVEPGGGLPTALLSGRNVAQLICHRDGRPFSPATQPKP